MSFDPQKSIQMQWQKPNTIYDQKDFWNVFDTKDDLGPENVLWWKIIFDAKFFHLLVFVATKFIFDLK